MSYRLRDAIVATFLFAAMTLVFTWPLARGLSHDIPGDFGDPLLNSWIVAWGASHLGRGWWHANIYFPHPLALAYSEHLLPQALQVLPVYAVTKNPILCYNLLFLSTFVLSGVGMFLFVRELTASREAAFVAGMAFAFAPYRVSSMPHLQVLSSAWMPFTLFGFRRYFDTGRTRPLIGGATAWLLQNLSCGYYFLFFSPIVLVYLVWELVARRAWRLARIVWPLAAACGAVAALTAPFMLPYVTLRRLGFRARSIDETTKFSGDVYAYLTANPNLHLWGPIVRAWPKAEGELFPGLTITALAVVAVVAAYRTARSGRAASSHVAIRSIAWTLVLCSAVLIALLFGWTLRSPIKITSVERAAWIVFGLALALLAASRDSRTTLRRWLTSPAGIFSALMLFAMVMSWGPSIHARGRTIAPTSLYALFYDCVPGFDGVRVPARFAMVVTFTLAVLGGLGAAVLARIARARTVAIAASLAIVLESLAIPIPINQNSTEYLQPGLAPLPGSLSASAVPPVYGFVSSLPAATAIVELPIGEPAFDVRYMFYSTSHWKPLVNGYSGGEPVAYGQLDQRLRDLSTRPERAWQALLETNATHAIVHETFYAGDGGRRVSDWLRSRGAREVAAFGGDRVFQIR